MMTRINQVNARNHALGTFDMLLGAVLGIGNMATRRQEAGISVSPEVRRAETDLLCFVCDVLFASTGKQLRLEDRRPQCGRCGTRAGVSPAGCCGDCGTEIATGY